MEKNIDFSEIANGNERLKYELDINFNTLRLLAHHVQELLDMNNSIEKLACLIDERCNLLNMISQSYNEECTEQAETIKLFIVRVTNEIEKLETLKRADILPYAKMTKDPPNSIKHNEMKEGIKSEFDGFLESISGFKKHYTGENCSFIMPESIWVDPIQSYSFLKKTTENFDPFIVKLTMNSINEYIRNLNDLYDLIPKGLDAFKFDQFFGLISILESKLGNNDPIVQCNTTNTLETKRFETTLDDNERLALCNKIIAESASDRPNYDKIFIGSINVPTLMYLLGGECPEKIVKIRMTTHQKVYELLLSISNHKFKDNICVPNFVKNKICPNVLLNKDGKTIKKLNERVP